MSQAAKLELDENSNFTIAIKTALFGTFNLGNKPAQFIT